MDYNDEDDELNEVHEPAPAYNRFMTPEQYLEWEDQQEEWHEYIDGEVITMTGGSGNHSRIILNVAMNITAFLKGKSCEAFIQGLRICLKTDEAYFYPDALIFCDDAKELEGNELTFTNPTVIFEVLSPSTAKRDLTKKLVFYTQIESLKEYITIDSRKMEAHMRRKKNDGSWEYQEIKLPEDNLFIQAINFNIPLRDIYDRIQFKSSPLKRID